MILNGHQAIFFILFFAGLTLTIFSKKKFLYFLGIALLGASAFYSSYSQQASVDPHISLFGTSKEVIFTHPPTQNLETKVVKNAILFSYNSLINGQEARPRSRRLFKGEGLKIQLLEDGLPVQFISATMTKADGAEELKCKCDGGDFYVRIKQNGFNTCFCFQLDKVGASSEKNYHVVASGRTLTDLQVVPRDSNAAVAMKAGERYDVPECVFMKADNAVMYVKGFDRNEVTSVTENFFWQNKTLHCAQQIPEGIGGITPVVLLDIDTVPFRVSELERGHYNVPAKVVLNTFSTFKLKLYKILESIYNFTHSTTLIVILLSLVYKAFTLFDISAALSQKKQQFSFKSILKVLIMTNVGYFMIASGIFCDGILWMKDGFSLMEDQIFVAAMSIVKSFVGYLITLGPKVLILVIFTFVCTGAFMLIKTILIFSDEVRRFKLSFHAKLGLIFLNLIVFLSIYECCGAILPIPSLTMFQSVISRLPIYLSYTIYSYIITLQAKIWAEGSTEKELAMSAYSAIFTFAICNLLSPLFPFFGVPIICIYTIFNGIFDLAEIWIVRKMFRDQVVIRSKKFGHEHR